MAGWELLTTKPAVYVCIIYIFSVSVYKVHWLTGVLKQGLWPLKQYEAMSLRARSRKLITCSKQDVKHEPRMSFKLWAFENGFVWCLIFIFRLHVLWIHLACLWRVAISGAVFNRLYVYAFSISWRSRSSRCVRALIFSRASSNISKPSSGQSQSTSPF